MFWIGHAQDRFQRCFSGYRHRSDGRVVMADFCGSEMDNPIFPRMTIRWHLIYILSGDAADRVRGDCRAAKRECPAESFISTRFFAEGRLPARTCVGVTGLAYDALIEIDLVCRQPADQ
jgi:hypothetical protein